jgi:hypothetical protein
MPASTPGHEKESEKQPPSNGIPSPGVEFPSGLGIPVLKMIGCDWPAVDERENEVPEKTKTVLELFRVKDAGLDQLPSAVLALTGRSVDATPQPSWILMPPDPSRNPRNRGTAP